MSDWLTYLLPNWLTDLLHWLTDVLTEIERASKSVNEWESEKGAQDGIELELLDKYRLLPKQP